MKSSKTGRAARIRRHERVRKTVAGTALRPSVTAHKYERGHTLAAASTVEKALKDASGNKSAQAKAVGAAVAKKAMDAGVTKVVFDRGGNRYHGRVKALAEAAREAGLQF